VTAKVEMLYDSRIKHTETTALRAKLKGKSYYEFDAKEGIVPLTILSQKRFKNRGKLYLKVFCEPADAPGRMRWTGPIRYEAHQSHMAGFLANVKDPFNKLSYPVYKVYLPDIGIVFKHKKQHWNVEYDKAKMIFGRGAEALMLRQSIHSQYFTLYKPNPDSKYGTLESGKEFLKLFNYTKREGVPRVFTYVIIDDAIHFSETGAAFFIDFLSKHALHSNVAEKVYFAGEFYVKSEEDKHTLFIDNDSGTYTPPKTHLPQLKEMFTRIFPDLDVKALDRSDPELKEGKQQTLDMNPDKKPDKKKKVTCIVQL